MEAAPARIGDDGRRALVPVLRNDQLIGTIELATATAISDADLAMIGRLAPQVAIIIQDAQVRNDPQEWTQELDSLLQSEGEIDMIEDAE